MERCGLVGNGCDFLVWEVWLDGKGVVSMGGTVWFGLNLLSRSLSNNGPGNVERICFENVMSGFVLCVLFGLVGCVQGYERGAR